METGHFGLEFECPHPRARLQLDQIPVRAMAQEISDMIVSYVDASFKYDQLKSPQVYSVLVRPIVDRMKRDYVNGGTFYCLMANKIHFSKESSSDVGSAQMWSTRSMVCEIVAVKLICEFDRDSLAEAMIYEFYPLADGRLTTATTIPNWLRVSTLELAIHAEAKRFMSHPALVELIADLWNGRLVIDPLLYKAHRLELKSRYDLMSIIESNKGIVERYGFSSASKLKLSRLRVPLYRHYEKVVSMFVLIFLYLNNLRSRTLHVSQAEVVFSCWALGFVLDELQSLRKAGKGLYFQTLWSMCDFCTSMLLVIYWALRAVACFYRSHYVNGWAYDVLAMAGVGMVPRVFCVLEGSEGFSRMVISVRKMSIELIYCWAAVMIFSLGFWASLSSFAKDFFSPQQVLYDLFQILFGFTPAVWQTWQRYSFLGALVLFLYLFMVQFVVMTMVIAALSARYSEIKEHSVEEYHYLQAVKTIGKIKTEKSTLFCYAEPLNVISWAIYPLVFVLPISSYLTLNRYIVKITHLPFLLIIYAYERLSWKMERRERAQYESQRERMQEYLAKSRDKKLASPNKKQRKRASIPLDTVMAKTSTLDLLEGALSQSHASPQFLTSPSGGPLSEFPSSSVEPHLAPFEVALDHTHRVQGLGISKRIPNHLVRGGTPHHEVESDPEPGPGVELGNKRTARRTRTFSTTSSLLRNYATLKLSPVRSYSGFKRQHGGERLGASVMADLEEDDLAINESNQDDEDMLSDEDYTDSGASTHAQKRIEDLLNILIERVTDLEARIKT